MILRRSPIKYTRVKDQKDKLRQVEKRYTSVWELCKINKTSAFGKYLTWLLLRTMSPRKHEASVSDRFIDGE